MNDSFDEAHITFQGLTFSALPLVSAAAWKAACIAIDFALWSTTEWSRSGQQLAASFHEVQTVPLCAFCFPAQGPYEKLPMSLVPWGAWHIKMDR